MAAHTQSHDVAHGRPAPQPHHSIGFRVAFWLTIGLVLLGGFAMRLATMEMGKGDGARIGQWRLQVAGAGAAATVWPWPDAALVLTDNTSFPALVVELPCAGQQRGCEVFPGYDRAGRRGAVERLERVDAGIWRAWDGGDLAGWEVHRPGRPVMRIELRAYEGRQDMLGVAGARELERGLLRRLRLVRASG